MTKQNYYIPNNQYKILVDELADAIFHEGIICDDGLYISLPNGELAYSTEAQEQIERHQEHVRYLLTTNGVHCD